MDKTMFLTYASSLTDIREVNPSFDTGILQIAYHGNNRNKTRIPKLAFERAIKSMYNCPIVCNYDRDTDTLGGHDIELVSDSEGMRVVNITTPIGCIPESAETYWKSVEEDDGTIHEYLCSDVVLWKRQEAYEKIKRNGVSAHSMEISVLDGEDAADGYYQVNDFVFTAFAIIGVEPCFESASLRLFSKSDFEQQFSEMMQEMKESFSNVNPSGVNEENLKFSTEGGTSTLDNNLANTVEDYGLEGDVREAIYTALSVETMTDEFGYTYPRYGFIDYDTEAGEVYCWDSADWVLYGFKYSMNGDVALIDFETKKRKKYSIVDFDEGEEQSPFANAYSSLIERAQKASSLEAKYNDAIESIDTLNVELNELKEFKCQVDLDRARSAKQELLDKFAELSAIDEYEALKSDDAGFDLEEIEEKCYAIRGKNNIAFSLNPQTIPAKVIGQIDHERQPYNGLFQKYGY